MFYRPIIAFPRTPVLGLTPKQVLAARGWDGSLVPASDSPGGFTSFGGTVLDSDLKLTAEYFGVPTPIVTRIGKQQPSDPTGANVENTLDFWSAWIYSTLTGKPFHLTMAFADNDSDGIETAVGLLRSAGIPDASQSWGAPESAVGRSGAASQNEAIAAFGGTFCVASGDNSANDGTRARTVDCPSGCPAAIGVGGVSLRNVHGSWMQAAWGDGDPTNAGAGGGYSAVFARPRYQDAVQTNAMRGAPDLADVADPETGLAVCVNGKWTTVGGTSGAAPIVCGMMAAARGALAAKGQKMPVDMLGWLYAHRSSVFQDVTVGSNGFPTVAGWDPVCGNGTLVWPKFLAALSGSAPPPSEPKPSGLQLADVLNEMQRYSAFLQQRNPQMGSYIKSVLDATVKDLQAKFGSVQ